jgi:hypothetical protein
MTIFDSLKYPIYETDEIYDIKMRIPAEIYSYWYYNYYQQGNLNRKHIQRIIAKYNTDECEIHHPRIFKSVNKDLYNDNL